MGMSVSVKEHHNQSAGSEKAMLLELRLRGDHTHKVRGRNSILGKGTASRTLEGLKVHRVL